jgi:hypothetical protein
MVRLELWTFPRTGPKTPERKRLLCRACPWRASREEIQSPPGTGLLWQLGPAGGRAIRARFLPWRARQTRFARRGDTEPGSSQLPDTSDVKRWCSAVGM